MKKLFIVLAAVIAVVMTGCKNEPDGLSIDPSLITCPDVGGDYTINVVSPNGAWTASGTESWIRVTPASGEQGTTEIRIKITANKESAESTGAVVFTCGDEKVTLPVTRAAKAAPYLRIVSETEYNTPKEGGTYTVLVESNIKWQIASNASWAKVDKGVSVNDDRITVTVSAATTPEETTAILTVKPYGEGEEAGEQSVTITRGSTDATSLSVDPVSLSLSYEGGPVTIDVSSTAKWRVYKTWDMDWVEFTGATEGEGDGSFGISVTPATSLDAISGVITIEEVRTDNYPPVSVQVAVSRAGKAEAYLSVNPTTINATAEGGTFPVEIKCNYPWTATLYGVKIFSTSITSGDGDAVMNVTVKPTTEEKEYTGYITITSSFGNEQARINIRREGKEEEPIPVEPTNLQVYPTNISTTYEGGQFTINVTANCAWTASSSDLRVASISPVSGTGSGTFSLFVPTTSLTTDSYAVITVQSEDGSVTETINVTRGGMYTTQLVEKPFSVSSSKKVYFSPGNLQYTQSTGKWTFADYQYDCLGLRAGIWELFGYSTGKNPTSTSGVSVLIFNEWGANAIYYQDIAYRVNTWRTLEDSEWKYLLNSRTDATDLRGAATVNNVHGYVLLPNNWTNPSGLSFTPNQNAYSANTYSIEDWRKMESNGAIFLPATGYRDNLTIYEMGDAGYYWTSSTETERTGLSEFTVRPVSFKFYYNSDSDNGMKVGTNGKGGDDGLCVRLVRDAN